MKRKTLKKFDICHILDYNEYRYEKGKQWIHHSPDE